MFRVFGEAPSAGRSLNRVIVTLILRLNPCSKRISEVESERRLNLVNGGAKVPRAGGNEKDFVWLRHALEV
jgi:hypothetical protein